MHGSTWRFSGDPTDLAGRYDALLAEVPTEDIRFHACFQAADGIVVVDTCPSQEVFDAFRTSEWFTEALTRHGLPEPVIVDYAVHAAFAEGKRIDE